MTSIGGATRRGIAALDLTGGFGDAALWDPNANNGARVRALAISGPRLYVGGDFTTIGGTSRRYLAGLGTTSDSAPAVPWNPMMGNAVYTIALCAGANCQGGTDHLAAGGKFKSANAPSRQNLAALDSGTGQPSSWNPSPNGPVNALELARGALYVGGNFTSIAGQARTRLAFFITKTGELNGWDPVAGEVDALHADSTRLYVGARRDGVGPSLEYHGEQKYWTGAFFLDTGELDNVWLRHGTINEPVVDIESDGDSIFLPAPVASDRLGPTQEAGTT